MVHSHYDAQGAYTGCTVVEPDPEWTDYNRSRALALLAAEATACPKCGSTDSMVEDGRAVRDVTWPNGKQYRVRSHVCQACGARDLVLRDWMALHENDEPQTAQAMPKDGRMLSVHRQHSGDK